MLRPVLAWRAFWNLRTVYILNFPIFFRAAVNSGYWISEYEGTPVLLVISGTDTNYRNIACRTIRNAVCLHLLWIFLTPLLQPDRLCDVHVTSALKTKEKRKEKEKRGLWRPAQLCFQHQIFTCSEVLWSFFAFRPENKPISCWLSAYLCSCSAIASGCVHLLLCCNARQLSEHFLISSWDLRFSQWWQWRWLLYSRMWRREIW
jgi:hypothetical protein